MPKICKNIVLISVFVGFSFFIHAQSKLDSLRLELNQTSSLNKKTEIYFKLFDEYLKSDLIKSLEIANQGLLYAKEIQNDTLIRNYYTRLGIVYVNLGSYELALKSFLQAQVYSKALNDKFSIRILKNNIGTVYDRMHQYDKALDIYTKLLNELLADTLTSKYNKLLLSLYNNIGNIYDIKDANQKALVYYQKCQVLSLKNNDSTSLSMVYKNIGDLYMKLDSLDVAEKYMKDALQIRLKLKNKAEICTNLLVLSQLEKKRKNYDFALDYVQQAFDISNEIGSISLQQQSLYVLAEIYELKNNIPQAFHYYKIFHNLTDSIFNERVSNEIVKLEVETIYKEQQKKLEEEQKARVKRLIFTLVAFIILFIIALLLYFLAQNRIWRIKLQKQNLALEKQTLELNLETKNKELITNVMYLVKKNELLKETIKQLLEASSVASAENKKNLQNIILHLQTSIDSDVWQDFEMRFNEVHSEFYQKLNDRYKELTPNEIKLCAFLKLNMTTKEISAITQQSARSIEVARVRLRKKLQITNTNVNLVSFLNEL